MTCFYSWNFIKFFANLRGFIYQILEIVYGMCKSNARKRAFPYDCTTKTAAVFCKNDFERVYGHNF